MVSSGVEIQVDRGEYTRIHNAILERLAEYDFTSREYACILHLLRQTYGFNRKEYKMSYGDFQDATGIDAANVSRTMRRLVDSKVVIKSNARTKAAATWSFNKYFEQWTIKSRLKTPRATDEIYCQNDSSLEDESIVEMAKELLSKQQEITAKVTIDDCQNDNSYIYAKDNIKDNSKDTGKDRGTAVNSTGYFGMPIPQRREKTDADYFTQQAVKAGVDKPTFVAIVNVLIEAARWRVLIDDLGDTEKLNYAKENAVKLIRLGNTTTEHVSLLVDMYRKSHDWRGDAPITPKQLTEYAGQVKDGLPPPQPRQAYTNGNGRAAAGTSKVDRSMAAVDTVLDMLSKGGTL